MLRCDNVTIKEKFWHKSGCSFRTGFSILKSGKVKPTSCHALLTRYQMFYLVDN